MSVFSKFNNKIDKEQLKKDIQEAKENKGGADVPEGTYEVEIEKMECKETSKHDPMLSVWFNIVTGEHKGHKLFANFVMQPTSQYFGFQMHKVIEFVESLGTDIQLEDNTDLVVFETWVDDVFVEIQDQGLEYELEFSKDKKGYDVYKITEVFEG